MGVYWVWKCCVCVSTEVEAFTWKKRRKDTCHLPFNIHHWVPFPHYYIILVLRTRIEFLSKPWDFIKSWYTFKWRMVLSCLWRASGGTLKLCEGSDCWKMTAVGARHDVVRMKWLPLNHDARQPKRGVEAKITAWQYRVPEVGQVLTLPVGCHRPAPPAHTSAATPLLSTSNSDTSDRED